MVKERTAHFGYKEVPYEEKVDRVKGVFSSVASRYDVMNDVMPFFEKWGINLQWSKTQWVARNADRS